MHERLENSASIAAQLAFQMLPFLSLIELDEAISVGSERHIAGFANEDRRRLGVLEGLDVAQTLKSLLALEGLAGGPPVWTTPIIAVRGDRVVLHGVRAELPDGSVLEHQTVRLYTRDMKLDRAIHFDLGQEHEALALLERLHAENLEPADPAAIRQLSEEWSRIAPSA